MLSLTSIKTPPPFPVSLSCIVCLISWDIKYRCRSYGSQTGFPETQVVQIWVRQKMFKMFWDSILQPRGLQSETAAVAYEVFDLEFQQSLSWIAVNHCVCWMVVVTSWCSETKAQDQHRCYCSPLRLLKRRPSLSTYWAPARPTGPGFKWTSPHDSRTEEKTML